MRFPIGRLERISKTGVGRDRSEVNNDGDPAHCTNRPLVHFVIVNGGGETTLEPLTALKEAMSLPTSTILRAAGLRRPGVARSLVSHLQGIHIAPPVVHIPLTIYRR